jgi:hypothetical protein
MTPSQGNRVVLLIFIYSQILLMVVFIVTGSVWGCMENSSKRPKRILIIITAMILAVSVGVGAFFFFNKKSSTSKVDQENKKIYDQTKALEVAPSGISNSNLTAINKLITEGKDAEAKTLIDKVKSSSGLQDYDKMNLYSSLGSVCSRLKDTVCLKEVIDFNTSKGKQDIYIIVVAAEVEKPRNPIASQEYYKKAKEIIDKEGGESYIERLNNQSDISLNYDEIIKGSQ